MVDNWHGISATLFLLAIGGITVFLIARALRMPGRYTFAERIIYAPVYALVRILWRVEVEWDPKWEQLLPSGQRWRNGFLRDRIQHGAVLVANHRASVDPFFIQLAAGCRVHWMVAGEYFHHFLFGPLLRSYQAIPTNRGGMDNAATKRAIRLANEGGFVGMFPEGRINRTDQAMLSIRPGAALVAARAGVPLVPIWIEGAPVGPEVYSALFMASHVRIRIGTPIYFPKSDTTEVNSDCERFDRAKGNEWITCVLEEMLRLGVRESERITIAGKGWVDS